MAWGNRLLDENEADWWMGDGGRSCGVLFSRGKRSQQCHHPFNRRLRTWRSRGWRTRSWRTRLLLSDSSVAVYKPLAGNVIDGGDGGVAGSSTASRTGQRQVSLVWSNRSELSCLSLVDAYVMTQRFGPGGGSRCFAPTLVPDQLPEMWHVTM